MKRNEILGEHKKGVVAVKYNKKPKDPTAEFGKAKEKLKPQKPLEEGAVKELSMDLKSMSDAEFQTRYKMSKADARANLKKKDEGYNPMSVDAQHRREMQDYREKEIRRKAETGDADAVKRLELMLKHKERMANDYDRRMEREGVEEMRDRRDAYQRDYDSSVSGMGDDFKRDFKRREMEHELGHETNNYAVAIDGRTWKVFASKNHAQAVARSLQNKGKKASVHETGAEPTTEEMGAEVGKITKVDPATKKATLTKADGSSMEVDSTALKPTPDGKMQMDVPDLKTGTAVVSTEDMMAPTDDSQSPINGDNDHDEISKLLVHRLKKLAGM